jgi:hypothetical protein
MRRATLFVVRLPFTLCLRVYDLSKDSKSPTTAMTFHEKPLVFCDFEELPSQDGFPDCSEALDKLIRSMLRSPRFQDYAARLAEIDSARALGAGSQLSPGERRSYPALYAALGLGLDPDSLDRVEAEVLFPTAR